MIISDREEIRDLASREDSHNNKPIAIEGGETIGVEFRFMNLIKGLTGPFIKEGGLKEETGLIKFREGMEAIREEGFISIEGVN